MNFNNGWETSELPIAGGVDTKTEEHALVSGKLLVLENGEFPHPGAIATRTGYTKVKCETSAGSFNARLLASRGTEHLAVSEDTLYSYSSALSQVPGPSWVDRGRLLVPTTTVQTALKERFSQLNGDYAEYSGVGVYAWEREGAGVFYAVVDSVTGTVHKDATLLDAGGLYPRVVTVGKKLHVYFTSTGVVRLKIIRPMDLATSLASSLIDVVSDLASSRIFQVKAYGADEAVILYHSTTGSREITGEFIDHAGSVVGGPYDVSTSVPVSLDIAVSPSLDLGVVLGTSTSTRYSLWRAGFGLFSSEAVVVSGAASGIRAAITSSETENDGELRWSVFWEEAGPAVRFAQFSNTDGLPTSTSVRLLSLSLGSGAFPHHVGGCVHLLHTGQLTDTYFLVYGNETLGNGSVTQQGRLYPGTSTAQLTSYHLPQVNSGVWVAVTKTRLEGLSDTDPQFIETSLNLVRYDFAKEATWVQAGQATYFAGAQLSSYDGVTLDAAGFAWFPELTLASFSTAPGISAFALGEQYTYRVYYEWINERNEIERSSGVAVTPAAVAATNDGYKLTIPTLTLTRKPGVTLAVYRTLKNPGYGAAFYRCSGLDPSVTSGPNCFVPNTTLATTVDFYDGMDDADLAVKERDYQNTGELDNVPCFAPAVVTTGKDRVFCAGGNVPVGSIQYSKYLDAFTTVSFSEALICAVNPSTGPVTALAVVQDTLVAFKRESIWIIEGDGSNNLGQGDFSPARLVTNDVGCTTPHSVVSLPGGVMFRSAKGFYVFSGGTPSYVGADVEKYNDIEVVDGHLVGGKNQVRFLLADSRALVYDYQVGQWSVFTNHPGISADIWDDRYAYSRTDGSIYWASGSHRDHNVTVPLKLRTAWIRPSVAQGLTIWRFLGILGHYHSEHTVHVRIYQDYNPYPAYTFSFVPKLQAGSQDSPIEATYWGQAGMTLGQADIFWGFTPSSLDGSSADTDINVGSDYSFVHGFKYQKASAVSIEVYTSPAPVHDGTALLGLDGGLELTHLSFEFKRTSGLTNSGALRKV